MNHVEGTFKSADGLELFYRTWLPDGEPKAVLAIVHGYGEHSGRYLNPVEHFVPRSYAVYALDLRGHGRSPGQRGHVERYDDYISDVQAFLAALRAAQPGRKLFLVGHSMGGLLALLYGLRRPQDVEAVIVSSPFLGLGLKAPGWKIALANALSSLWPNFAMSNTDLHNEDLSHDPAVVAAAGQDPLNHRAITPRWFTETTAAQAFVLEHAGEFKPALLVLYAAADKIADPKLPPRFFERVAHSDKAMHAYDGYYHEIFNETGKQAVLADMEAWLAQRI